MDANDQVIHGVPTPPDEQQELTSLQSLFDPKSAMDRLDAYGKWIFGAATIVGTLGAGFSNAAFSKLRGFGVITFAAGVGIFGVALFFASLSIAPHWVEVKTTQLASLRTAVNSQFASRQKALTVAATTFGIALLLAAFSPLISLAERKTPPIVNYTIDDKSNLDATLEGSEFSPGESVSLRLETADGVKTVLASAGGTADGGGHLKLELKKTAISSVTNSLVLVSCVGQSGESTCPHERRFDVK